MTHGVSRRTRWTRDRRGLLLGAIVLMVLYAATLLLYLRSTLPPDSARPHVPEREALRAVLVWLDISAVSPAESQVTGQLKVGVPERLVDEDASLKQTLVIELVAVDANPLQSRRVAPFDATTVTFEKGTRLFTAPVTLSVQGEYQDYPLDRYAANLAALASTLAADGARTDLRAVLDVGGQIPGWRVFTEPQQFEEGVELETADPARDSALLTVRRSGSTMAIVALVLIALLVIVAVALLVARAVLFKRRRIEATMASWFAALMFAVIPLRTNLPGSPPMGVWMDFLVVLWVEIGLMIALAIFIASWLRYTPLPDYAPERAAAIHEADEGPAP